MKLIIYNIKNNASLKRCNKNHIEIKTLYLQNKLTLSVGIKQY